MSADFNAGSIEGTLGLDSTPFRAGLDKAKADAAEFEQKKIEPSLGLDTGEFDAKKTTANTALDRFGLKKETAKADLDIAPALAKFAILNKILDAGGLGKGTTSFGLMTSKVLGLTGGVLGLLSVLGPLSGVLGGIGAAGIAAFGGIMVSMGLFTAAAKSAFGVITAANKAGVDLTGWAGKAQDALKGLTDGWHKLVDSVKPQMFALFTSVFTQVAAILPKLAPLLKATTEGVNSFVNSVLKITRTPIFGTFLHDLSEFMGKFLSGAGPVIEHLLSAFMHIFVALEPLMAVIGHGIAVAAADFDKFGNSLQHGGITPFIGYVAHWLPVIIGLFGSLFSGVKNLLGGIAPLAGPAIHFIEALVKAVGGLHLAPLAKGFGDMFDALRPLLPVLGMLVNTLLGPLGHLLSSIAQDAIVPLTHSLKSEMVPAFHALHQILHALIEPISLFVASIANLANPTGVHLVTALLIGLVGAVKTLAPSLSKLAVALESVIDDGLTIIIPLIPTLSAALSVVVGYVSGFAGALAVVLSHKAVVDVLLGLAAAVWLGVKAFQAYQLAVRAIAFVTGIFEAISFGWAGLTVAQDANTASMVANKIGMIAWRVWALASAAASKVMAAGMWLVNAAMDANPITLVVLAVAALAAGLIYAYKHSETFRKIVDVAFKAVMEVGKTVLNWLVGAVKNTIDFVKQHWQLLLAILTGPIGAALIFLISHWAAIKTGFSNLMSDVQNIVSTGVNNVEQFFVQLPGKLLNLVGSMVNAGKALMGGIFHGLESAATSVGGFAANIASSIWHELESVLNNILPHTLSINKGPIHVNVPLFPYLASGGVTNGPTPAMIGDNPGGREAVVPLDKYDLPRRGEITGISGRSHEDSGRIITLLTQMVGLLAKGTDHEALAEAIGTVVGKQSDANTRRMIQMARAT
jgi:phage-related protein